MRSHDFQTLEPRRFLTLTQATWADRFVDSVGVATQITFKTFSGNFNGTNYTNAPTAYNSPTLIKNALQYMNVRHIRAGLRGGDYGNNYTSVVDSVIKPLGQAGIKTTFAWDANNPNTALDLQATQYAAPYLAAVEGVNEPGPGFTYNGQSYPASVRAYQQDLYNKMKSSTTTSGIPIIGPSPTDTNLPNLNDLVNFGNVHPYALNAQNPDSQLFSNSSIFPQKYASGLPFVATEGGYHTAYNNNPGSSQLWGVNDELQAAYLTRFFLDGFRNGYSRTFSYQLFDQAPNLTDTDDYFEQCWGLYRFNGTTTVAKPAANAIRALTGLLKDTAVSNYNPSGLDFDVITTDTSIKHQLFQKSDGKFYLAMWRDHDNWNTSTKSFINNTYPSVRVKFTSAVNNTVNIYRLNTSTGNADAQAITLSGDSIWPGIGKEVTVYQITPTATIQGNVLKNPSFDANPNQYSDSVGAWNTWNNVSNPGVDFTETYGGVRTGSHHLTHYSGGAYQVATYQDVTNLANGTYQLSAWVRSSGGFKASTMYISSYGGAELSYAIPASGEWRLIHIDNINLTTGKARVGFWSDANASNWIHVEDVVLVKSSAPLVGQVITMRASANSKFVNGGNAANLLSAIDNSATDANRFTVIDAGNGRQALRNLATNLYVSADLNLSKQLIANRSTVGAWEQFSLSDQGNGNFGLYAYSSAQYVSAENAGANPLVANRPSIGAWELFRLL
jgi:hypothetical protein